MEEEEALTPLKQGLPVIRAEGGNESERYLKRLCEHSFLSLWSYPCTYRNERLLKPDGKKNEICDLLVVFGNHILIFQDKDIILKNTGDLETDWKRWYRKAVQDGAKQIWGAEHWLKQHPDNIFLDKDCTQPFPISLPDPVTAQYHRIIVAHGASERCKQHFGGSGSLIIVGDLLGSTHADAIVGEKPFAIGQINPTKGFVHIFDD